jgi:serine/threonine protein kinase
MKYLHEQRQPDCLYRDLEPDNIGLEKEGKNVQLFEFGMARRVEACLKSELAETLSYGTWQHRKL